MQLEGIHHITAITGDAPRNVDFYARLLGLERAGFVAEHVEGFAGDYARTLEHWADRLDSRSDEAIRLAGPERVRVWRLYLRAARHGFETGFTSVYQVLCRRPG